MENKKIIVFEMDDPRVNYGNDLNSIRQGFIFDLNYIGLTILKNPTLKTFKLERYSQVNFIPKLVATELKFSSISAVSSAMEGKIPPIPEIKEDGSLVLDIFFNENFIDRREFPNPVEYFEDFCSTYKEDEDLPAEESSRLIKEMLGEKVLNTVISEFSSSCVSCTLYHMLRDLNSLEKITDSI